MRVDQPLTALFGGSVLPLVRHYCNLHVTGLDPPNQLRGTDPPRGFFPSSSQIMRLNFYSGLYYLSLREITDHFPNNMLNSRLCRYLRISLFLFPRL